ncbi:PREDICTED: WD repeat-containing protein 18 [Dinoponera quadriceps]|uniref:WD repeat-containing protein 18 n=1 Tax=Dinoponera quadriceps TaxID=609295 RepID=A0A6P3YG43_DINQU|nr:PREDICTED: WD repeat-containing protein 18 [Dinoponera quadriceps]
MQRASDRRLEVLLTSEDSGEGCNAALWDPSNGSRLSIFKNGGTLSRRTLQLLNDCYLLGADHTKNRIHVWPLNNPSPLNNIRLTAPGRVSALTCTPNGTYMIAAVADTLYIWQVCNGRLVGTLNRHLQTIKCLSVTKDGSLFASAGEDGLVFVWSLYSALNDKRCSPVHKFSDHTQPVGDVYFGHGGTRGRLYTASLDRTVNVYEMGSGVRLVSIVFPVPLTVIAVNITDSELFVGCVTGDILQCNLHEPPRGIEQHVRASDDDAGRNAVYRAHKSEITALSVSVDCRTLVSGSTDKAVHIWDIVSRLVLRTIEHKGSVTAAFLAPAFENFFATTLKPSLELRNLQQTASDDSSRCVIEVINRSWNPKEFLDFKSFMDEEPGEPGISEDTDAKQNMAAEYEKLKQINKNLFQYAVANTLRKANGRQAGD